MVTTLSPNTTTIYDTIGNAKYSGVAKVSYNGSYGTGTLLYDGRAILTAAHLFSTANLYATITFDLSSTTRTFQSNNITIIPSYDSVDGNNDLAIVWLDEQAPKEALRSELYRATDEISQEFSFVGYGVQGTGLTGENTTSTIEKLVSLNRFDSEAGALKDILGNTMAWTPIDNNILIADFDDGTIAHDALGDIQNIQDLGTGIYEGMISPGDSGGPAFIDSKIAGIASYGASLSNYNTSPDIDTQLNSSFGETGFWHRVSSYQQFIDESLRANYTNQPTTAQEVVKQIQEGNLGDLTVNYFFLEVTGFRDDVNTISVQYSTRDATAKAGEDYIAVSGQINVYPTENYVLIPVEIIGDNLQEEDEVFYLDIFDPVGAIFENNQVILTAQRTILNDDILVI